MVIIDIKTSALILVCRGDENYDLNLQANSDEQESRTAVTACVQICYLYALQVHYHFLKLMRLMKCLLYMPLAQKVIVILCFGLESVSIMCLYVFHLYC